jgi:PAS domain S-box-containing protein
MGEGSQSRRPDTELFHDVFNASPIGIVVENLDGQPLFVNPAFCALLGFSEEQLRKKHCVDFSPPEDAEKDWALFQQLRAGSIDHYQLEKRYFRRDGSLFWGRLSLSLLNGRTSPLVIAMVEDITDKKTAEEALLRHAAVIESSDDAIVSGTLDGIIVSWNKGAQKIYGYTEAEAIGQPINMLSPLELPDEENRILETLKAGGRIEHFETVRVTKTGKRINVSLTISPINDSSGRTVGCSGIARDITERKQAEDAIRESEIQYRRIVETTNEGVWLLDSKLHTSYVNRQMAEMLGYEPEEMVGRSVLDFYFSEDVERKKQGLEKRQQGLREQFEERLRRRDGSELWVRLAATPVFKDNGEFDGALAMISDITERKRSDEALLKSEERFRLAAQAGKMFAYELDVATDVIVRSEDFARILGNHEHVETTGQKVLARIHSDDREKVKAAVAALSPENPNLQITYRMQRLDGIIIWVERNSQAHFDDQGKIRRIVGMVKDVTDRHEAEEALRISEERLRLAQWAAHIGTFDVNIRTGVDVWQPETEALYGLPPGGFGGTLTAFEDLIHPDDRERVIQLTQEMMRTGQAAEAEWRVVWPDGSVHWIAGRGQVLMDESGVPSRMLGVNMDVTERKRAEEALSGMTRKLLQAQEQERARIARELHDDINQRLALMAVELEQLQSDPSDVPIRAQQLRKELAQISDDVQTLSHELHSSKLDYLGVVAGMKSWCKEFAGRQNINIDFKSDVSSILPSEIGLSLFRVLQEALHNAVKYSGVRRFDVQLRENPREIHLAITDSGRGFDVEAAMQGTGLGLTSMRERVRLVNGTILIESKPTHGTSIHVRVPLRPDDASQRAVG